MKKLEKIDLTQQIDKDAMRKILGGEKPPRTGAFFTDHCTGPPEALDSCTDYSD